MHISYKSLTFIALIVASSFGVRAYADSSRQVKAVAVSPASTPQSTPMPVVKCPYEVQTNGTCQALVTITSVSYVPNAVNVSIDVKNLTNKPLQNVIVDAEAFTSDMFQVKVGQTSMIHQNIPLGDTKFTINVPTTGQSTVMSASIFGAASGYGIYGPGESNFARSND